MNTNSNTLLEKFCAVYDDVKMVLEKSSRKVFNKKEIFPVQKAEVMSTELKPSEEAMRELKDISEYLKVSLTQSLIIIIALVEKNNDADAILDDIARYFKMNTYQHMHCEKEFHSLVKLGYLVQSERSLLRELEYYLNEDLAYHIQNDLPMPEIKVIQIESAMAFIYTVEKIIYNTLIPIRIKFSHVNEKVNENMHLPFVHKIHDLKLKPEDMCLLLSVFVETLMNRESTILELASNVSKNTIQQHNLTKTIVSGTHHLVMHNYLEVIKAEFADDAKVELGESMVQLIKEEGLVYKKGKAKLFDVIVPEKIHFIPLFFNESEQCQLEKISQMLEQKNLVPLQQRLKEKKMPVGVPILLYGPSGTGKTESVLQIAKATGREMLKIEISQSKSMWFGESEKTIKKIFTQYEQLVQKSKQCPILFFNEADAIISRRKDISFSAVAQTENAMQNILLEELENFKGILFATTNLVTNLDEGFDRRFLFKVEFTKPDLKTRSKIWKSKLEQFDDSDCERLANDFDFSGGQIQNIVRKATMIEVLDGRQPDINELIGFCQNELLDKIKPYRQIGFDK
ncbi:hypothetical protein CHS0354_023924 [Potamilus streckersoni]|uniref:AAA+ ATPase domain-containing protein n=1 Tax=Potamilus streckersoni TaxID=2493646 RepID=A0AAE0RZH9_9BIVA|nr:hypothetical protein CHS0354_023924 [Potamilus streckersoni]